MPGVVEGTSIDTLSVSISNRLSPGFTASPADLNHFVILPSATVSPSCGISTSISVSSLEPLPVHDIVRARRIELQSIAFNREFTHQVRRIARLHAALAMMRHGLRSL